jgi:DNA polymerase-3 subunit delta
MLEFKFFIAGSDRFSIAKRGNEIAQSFGGIEIEVIDGDADKISEVVQELRRVCETLRTVSLFSEKKLVWYRDVSFLGDAKINRGEDVLDWLRELQNLLESIPEVGCLITTGVVDKRQKIIKWFLENCHSEVLDTPKLVGCEHYIREVVERERKKIPPQSLEKFLQKTGNDLAVIANELTKLLIHVGDRDTVDVRDIDAIVVDWRDGDFFEMIDLFFEENFETFSAGIRRYFAYHGEGRPLLAALQNRVRLLIQLCYFHENDGVESINKSVMERLRDRYAGIYNGGTGSIFTQNPWYLGKLLAIAKKCSLNAWIQFQIKLLESTVALSENYGRQQSIFENLYFQLKLVAGGATLSSLS